MNPQGIPLPNGTIASSDYDVPMWAAFRRDELFVAQQLGSNVLRFVFDSAGNALPNGAITAGLGGQTPRGVTVTPSDELLVTECCGVDEINRYLFDASGNAISNGIVNGGGLSSPHDMVFSPWGELFVTSVDHISRFIFDASGNASPNGQIAGSTLDSPIGLAFSPWGELFVSNHAGVGGISRWLFDASFNAIPNGSFATPQTLGDIAFFPTAVPEPSAINLIAVGMVVVGLGVVCRRPRNMKKA